MYYRTWFFVVVIMNLIGPEMSPGLNVTMTVLIRNVFVLGK